MELTDLKYFLIIADELSFTKASDVLLISQPSLSQRIARLETELGGLLFTRTSRGLVLTPSGRDFYRRAQLITSQAQSAKKAFHAVRQGQSGSINIGASGSIANSLLPRLLSEYFSSHPDIALHITERRSPELIQLMEKGALDLALVYAPHPPTNVPMTVLMGTPLIAVMPANHPHAQGKPVMLSAFRNDRFILLAEPGESYYNFIMELCSRHEFLPTTVCTGVEVDTAFRLAEQGIGVAIVSSLGINSKNLSQHNVCSLTDDSAYTSVVLLSQEPILLSGPAREFYALLAARKLPADGQ